MVIASTVGVVLGSTGDVAGVGAIVDVAIGEAETISAWVGDIPVAVVVLGAVLLSEQPAKDIKSNTATMIIRTFFIGFSFTYSFTSVFCPLYYHDFG